MISANRRRIIGASLAITFVTWFLGLRGIHGAAQPEVRPGEQPSSATVARRLILDKYCVTCHNQRAKTAGLVLDSIDVEHIAGNAEVWEKVLRKVRSRDMPPAGMPRPDAATYDVLSANLEAALDQTAATRSNPGRVPLRRMTRAEYTNAIRDLLALEIDGTTLLPADEVNEGFDNMAGALPVSPALLERYISAARRVSRLAVGDSTIGPAFMSKTYSVPRMLFQEDRMSDDLPFGSRGGISIRHLFPLDGDYLVKVTLLRNNYSYIKGLDEPQQIEVRIDGQKVKVFDIGGQASASHFIIGNTDLGRPAPPTWGGNFDVHGGTSAEWETYMLTMDAALEVRVPVRAGMRVVGVSFVKTPWLPEGVLQPPQTGFALSIDDSSTSPSGVAGAAVAAVTVNGPYEPARGIDTPSRRRIFVCHPTRRADEDRCARSNLSTVARRAYRRPLAERDIQTLTRFYRAARGAGSFEDGIQGALEQILVAPEFLFRIERDPSGVGAGTAYQVSDLELASRLSFFLWSSLPDDELLQVAAERRLEDPAILERQVRRMLADQRSRALVDNFAAQWLELRRLATAAPNPELFPEFDENLREAFQRETELFVASQLREDRPVMDLLTANYTFVNERLAQHYGIPNVFGTRFRRVTFDKNTPRGGLLGHGGILMVTSYGNRTSPVIRGKWMLDNIFGTPPPPPPPNVPALSENRDRVKGLSIRERMQQHRANPICAGCHARMDVLGFALENFDAIGKWRSTTEEGVPVDTSGLLPDGTRFAGLPGLQQLAVSHRDEFVTTVTEKLLMYAMGRGVEYYDMPAVRKILREAKVRDYRWSSIILGIVKSIPFQMRRSES